ncbi:hypothetical protein [Sphingomonas koreensis]
MIQTDADDSFDFAVMRTPTWALTATTNVDWRHFPAARYPTVASIECNGESQQFHFSMDSTGDVSWLHARLLGTADDDGERNEITLLGDRIWLYIDGERWEYANIPEHSGAFSNILYPAPESDIIVSSWRGYQAVRRAEDQPWINLKLIYHRLITAMRIEWSFKSRDWAVVDKNNVANQLPRNWRNTRYKVDNQGLHDAVFWCARQVSSEDAYILPARMLERANAPTEER